MKKILERVNEQKEQIGFLAIGGFALIVITMYYGITTVAPNDGVNLLLVFGGVFANGFIFGVFYELTGTKKKKERLVTGIVLQWVAIMTLLVINLALNFEMLPYTVNVIATVFGLASLILFSILVSIK